MRQRQAIENQEALTATEAVLKYGLSWKVLKKDHGIIAPNAEDFTAIVREDTGDIFQFAKKGYTPIQNGDVFREIDSLVETGQAKYVQGGSYKGGAVVWLRLRVPSGDFEPKPGDKHRTYLRVITSHDGSIKFTMVPEVYRMICSNGMHAWTEDAAKAVSVKHTANALPRFRMRASEVLATEIEYFKRFAEASRRMAQKQMTTLEIDSFLAALFNVEGKETDAIAGRTRNQIEQVKDLCFAGTGIKEFDLQNTAYGVYNAVTEFIGKYRPTRGEAENAEYSEAFGSGKALRERAFELLTK